MKADSVCNATLVPLLLNLTKVGLCCSAKEDGDFVSLWCKLLLCDSLSTLKSEQIGELGKGAGRAAYMLLLVFITCNAAQELPFFSFPTDPGKGRKRNPPARMCGFCWLPMLLQCFDAVCISLPLLQAACSEFDPRPHPKPKPLKQTSETCSLMPKPPSWRPKRKSPHCALGHASTENAGNLGTASFFQRAVLFRTTVAPAVLFPRTDHTDATYPSPSTLHISFLQIRIRRCL